MFETQHYMELNPDTPKKRGREDEQEFQPGATSFSEHRNKRLQSLPVRTSPRAGNSVTPLDASPAQFRHSHIEAHTYMPSEPQTEQDTEMDMTETGNASPCPHHASSHLAASHLEPEVDPSTGTNRMPTPIQPSFAAQVRGQQHDWAGNNDNVPRTMASEGDWQNVQNNRRLPSPISECDDMHVNLQPPSPHGMQHPNAMMEDRASSQPPEADGESPMPSPERRGHMRSKHTINSWTWQPGMKKSFSIGYRADCDKCRDKVPGHFNHIVIS